MIGVLFSGGKDSVFTTYYFLEQGWQVKCLITMKSKNKASWMFHTPAIDMTRLQAQSMGLPLVTVETRGEKEAELKDLHRAIKQAKEKYGLRGIAVGALLSDYQQERVNRICHSLGLKCFAPLWHKSQAKLLKELISLGFDMRIVGVASFGFDENWLGRKIDEKAVAELCALHKKYYVHVGGEGGEYESLVVDCPVFSKRIELVRSDTKMESNFSGRLEIFEARLAEKPAKQAEIVQNTVA